MYLQRLSDVAELKPYLEVFQKGLPRSFYFLQHFKCLIQFGFGDFEIYKVKASRDADEEGVAVLSVCEDNVSDYGKYAVYYDDNDCYKTLAVAALKERVDWSKSNILQSMPAYQRPMLEVLMRTTGTKIHHETKCVTLALHDINKLPEQPPEAEHVVKRIVPGLAHIIDSHWKFREENTEDMIRRELETRKGFGAFVDGSMVSWVVMSKYAALSHLHTDPGSRGRGYASMVVDRICRHLWELNITPVADVEIHNEGAIRLFKRLGFTEVFEMAWVLCGS